MAFLILAINSSVVVFSILAATAWLRAATVQIASDMSGTTLVGSDDGSVKVSFNGIDVIETGIQQAKWNRRAAILACIAAAFQAAQSALQLLT